MGQQSLEQSSTGVTSEPSVTTPESLTIDGLLGANLGFVNLEKETLRDDVIVRQVWMKKVAPK